MQFTASLSLLQSSNTATRSPLLLLLPLFEEYVCSVGESSVMCSCISGLLRSENEDSSLQKFPQSRQYCWIIGYKV